LYPELYLECEATVLEHGRATAKMLGIGYFHRSIAEFSFAGRAPLTPAEWGLINATEDLFKGKVGSADAER
jgi:hypothetical protein